MRVASYLFFVISAVRLQNDDKASTQTAHHYDIIEFNSTEEILPLSTKGIISFNTTEETKQDKNRRKPPPITIKKEGSKLTKLPPDLDADDNTNSTNIVGVVENKINDTYTEKGNNEPWFKRGLNELLKSLSDGVEPDPDLNNYFEAIIFEPETIAGLSLLPIPPPPPGNHDSAIIRYFGSVSSIYEYGVH